MTEQNQPIRIRAHTLVCLQGYQGEGYSEDFVNEMDRVTATLKNDPDRERAVAVEEQRKITRLRLKTLIGARES